MYEAYKKQVEAVLPTGLLYRTSTWSCSRRPLARSSQLFTQAAWKKGWISTAEEHILSITHTTGLAGSPNVGDSLAAIKKAVFEDKKITMGRLVDALDKNFEGEDEVLHLLKKAPKYGNDDDYADLSSGNVLVHSCDILRKHTTFAGIKSTASGNNDDWKHPSRMGCGSSS